jgi:hypothetical protein
MQSHCPYASKCIDMQCSVICPKPFFGKKIEAINNDENREILSQEEAEKLVIENI